MAIAGRSAAAEEGEIDGHRREQAEGSKGGEAEADQRGTAPLSRKRAHQQLAGRRHSPPLTVANYLINPTITHNRYSTESQALQAKTPLGS